MSKIIILDWDDTLFPTSWCLLKDINIVSEDAPVRYKNLFEELDNILYTFLLNCKKYGKIYIVTNAMEKWIHKSSLLLKKTNEIIKKHVYILSARDLCQKYTTDINVWKILVFKYIANNDINSKNRYHIISIGDAEYEFNALLDLFDHHNTNNSYLKAIKLVQTPSYDSLVDQLNVLNNSIHKICTKNGHMDLKFRSIN